MNAHQERDRLRDARLIMRAIHPVRDEALVAEIAAALVRVTERSTSFAALDALLLRAIPLVQGARVGAIKRAIDGVESRCGAAKQSAAKARPSATKPLSTDGASGVLFAADAPAPEPRIVPPSGELVFVDTETTGLRAGAHQVIEIGAMTMDGAEFVALVRLERGAEVDAGAMAVNKIDLRGREWRENAVSLRDALTEFVRWLPTGAVLVAHNAAFDRRMLEADAARVGVVWPSVEWFCTKVWADELRKRGVLPVENSKLHTLCEHFDVPNDGEHRALADVVRMARVFDALVEIDGAREAA